MDEWVDGFSSICLVLSYMCLFVWNWDSWSYHFVRHNTQASFRIITDVSSTKIWGCLYLFFSFLWPCVIVRVIGFKYMPVFKKSWQGFLCTSWRGMMRKISVNYIMSQVMRRNPKFLRLLPQKELTSTIKTDLQNPLDLCCSFSTSVFPLSSNLHIYQSWSWLDIL